MAHLLPFAKQQFFDSNGLVLAGGKIYFYAAGTSTPLAAYTDSTENTQQTNPVILDAAGEAPIWLGSSTYKIVIKDSLDNVLRTVDNVAHLVTGEVTTAKIADGAVTAVKLATNSVSTVKVQDGAITKAKLAAISIVTQALTGLPSSATSATALTGTCTVTSTGRPVAVGLIGKLNSVASFLKVSGGSDIDALATIEIFRGSTRLSTQTFGRKKLVTKQTFTSNGTYTVPAGVTYIYVDASGGGGGGGAGGTSLQGGSGGGGSFIGGVRVPVTPGDTLTITIGAGGAAGNINGGAGSAGGDTYITNGSSVVIFRVKGGGGGPQSTTGGAGRGWGGNGGGSSGSSGVAGSNRGDDDVAATGGAAGGNSGGGSATGGGGGGAGWRGSVGGAGGQSRASNPGLPGAVGSGYGAGGGGSAGDDTTSVRSGAAAAGTGGCMEIFTDLGGDEFVIPASAISIIDSAAPAAANAYTVKVYVNNASTVLSSSGDVLLQAYEL